MLSLIDIFIASIWRAATTTVKFQQMGILAW